ncbi:MAG: hypothetical protein GEV11_15845 [Streptosporangiales bacterium]|nr:hypothetical protein [Streptosporangiales bacterium]
MGGDRMRERASRPEDLGLLLLQRLNAGDVDGLVALYEPDAVLAFPPGEVTVGSDDIREVYTDLLADRPRFEPGRPQPALINGNLAVTSTRLPNGDVTVEVARRQPDGSWLWVIDQPSLLGQG